MAVVTDSTQVTCSKTVGLKVNKNYPLIAKGSKWCYSYLDDPLEALIDVASYYWVAFSGQTQKCCSKSWGSHMMQPSCSVTVVAVWRGSVPYSFLMWRVIIVLGLKYVTPELGWAKMDQSNHGSWFILCVFNFFPNLTSYPYLFYFVIRLYVIG